MIALLIASQILSWLLILVMALALVALARQIGVLHERLAPAGALLPSHGLKAGSAMPDLHMTTLDGRHLDLGGVAASGRRRLLFFVSSQCPVCKKLIPAARSFASAENLELVFMGDDTREKQEALVAAHDLHRYPFVNSPDAGRLLQIDKLPHAILVSAEGRIVARGLVNSREHLESLVVSDELGLGSVQEYLQTRHRVEA